MRLSALHEAYLRDLMARGASPLTQQAYRGDFGVLREFLGDDIRGLTSERVSGYIAWLGQRTPKRKTGGKGDAPQTISRRLASASAFADWLVDRGDLARNPFRRLKRPKRPRRLPRGVPVGWLDAVFALQDLSAADRVLVGLMRYCGLRISDITGLDIQDIDLAASVLVIRDGKGRKDRAIPLDAELTVILTEYLGNLGKEDLAGPLLCGRRRKRVSPKVVYRWIRRLTRRTGIPYFTPHPVRHTFATEAAKAGMPLPMLQAILGHESADTTQLYFDVVGHDLRSAMAALTEWRKKA